MGIQKKRGLVILKTEYRKQKSRKRRVCRNLICAGILSLALVAFMNCPEEFTVKESAVSEKQRMSMTSKEITDKENAYDKEVLAQQPYDFSDVTIACLGDSITEGVNGATGHADGLTYPQVMEEVLGAKEVYNLGIGGSTIGDYWAAAMVNRYMEIPADTDIILVYGGINDVFSGTDVTMGDLETLETNTFCGDLDALLKGIRANYQESWLILVTPMDSVTIEEVRALNPDMEPIEDYVNAMVSLAQKYNVDVIDLFHNNFLNSYDPGVYEAYVPGCHPTDAGYRILGEHIAKEVIRISLENDADGEYLGKWNGYNASGNSVSGNAVSGNGISGNEAF